MLLKIPIGISDFRMLRENGAYFVDKSFLIRDLLDLSSQVVLLPRPRRFGKTMNMSMLQAFLEKTGVDSTPLFSGLSIWEAGAAYRAHFQRYPVIALTFKDAKYSTFDACLQKIRQLLAVEFERHASTLGAGVLSPAETALYQTVVNRRADLVTLADGLLNLSMWLRRATGERVVVLLDEYDAPLQAGFTHKYYDQVTEFFRNFLSAGLKDNPSLFKGVLTGVLRIARESIFSGLNNISVYGVLDQKFADTFGFTEPEVEALLRDLGQPERMADVRRWYNGYSFGGRLIYNPWSVLNYAQNPEQGFRPYWVFTSSEDVLRELVLERGYAVLPDFAALLEGEGQTITRQVSEHVVLRDLHRSKQAVWSLLLLSGYLTARSVRLEEGRHIAELAIPNVELRYVFEESITSWMTGQSAGNEQLDEMLDAMLSGDTALFARHLAEVAARVLSYHDAPQPDPERVYHGFVLGLLARLSSKYQVRSNRESKFGRPDVMVIPRTRGRPGVVLEFKGVKSDSQAVVEQALAGAVEQITSKGYTEEPRASGAAPVWAYAVACHGKQVWVRKAGETETFGSTEW